MLNKDIVSAVPSMISSSWCRMQALAPGDVDVNNPNLCKSYCSAITKFVIFNAVQKFSSIPYLCVIPWGDIPNWP